MATSTPLTAQSLFTDGVHSIFAFLGNCDWLNSIRACRDWYRIGSSIKTTSTLRQFTFTERTLGFKFIRDGQSSPLRRHLDRIEWKSKLLIQQGISEPTLEQWKLMINHLPYYTSLRTLRIDQLPLSVDVTPLRECRFLTQIILPIYDEIVSDQFFSRMLTLSQVPNLTSLNIVGQTQQSRKVFDSITTLLYANDLNEKKWIRFLKLEQFSLHQGGPRVDSLNSLFTIAPNLTTLTIDFVAHMDAYKKLIDFSQLRSLTLNRGGDITMSHYHAVDDVLRQCKQLTHIGWMNYCGSSSSSSGWNCFFTELPFLTSLSFIQIGSGAAVIKTLSSVSSGASIKLRSLQIDRCDCTGMKLDHFRKFDKLKSLHIQPKLNPTYKTRTKPLTFDQLRNFFDDSSIMPELESLVINLNSIFTWNRHSDYDSCDYRKRNVASTTSAQVNLSAKTPNVKKTKTKRKHEENENI